MARRKRKSSRSLRGLGASTFHHTSARLAYAYGAIKAFKSASVHAAEGKCKTALEHLLEGQDGYGGTVAHQSSGGQAGKSRKVFSELEFVAEEATEMFKGACLDRSKLSGLGRMKRRSRR